MSLRPNWPISESLTLSYKWNQQDQGSRVAPQGCKISPCNSTISIEPNFTTFDKVTSVESIKHNLKWPKNGPDMAPI